MTCAAPAAFSPAAPTGFATVLGVETSCDETAAAVVHGGRRVRSSVVTSQIDLHRAFGGVVPEIASRAHLQLLPAAVTQALAGAELEAPEAVAATAGPGLLGALVVGVSAAKALALAWDVPFVAVNHLEAHLYAAFLEGAGHTGGSGSAAPTGGSGGSGVPAAAAGGPADPVGVPKDRAAPAAEVAGPSLPMLVLLVSGGHTLLVEMTGHGRYELLGQTLDDAAGEAYDKVARLLGLGYPGGPAIDRLAAEGDPEAIGFPRPMLADGLDFSFSGLKTAVAVHLRRCPDAAPADVAASFQRAVTDVLEVKTLRAAEARGVNSLCLAGGVAANSELRSRFEALGEGGMEVFIPSRAMCTDNAAMVAAAGWHQLQRQGPSPLDTAPKATWMIPTF